MVTAESGGSTAIRSINLSRHKRERYHRAAEILQYDLYWLHLQAERRIYIAPPDPELAIVPE